MSVLAKILTQSTQQAQHLPHTYQSRAKHPHKAYQKPTYEPLRLDPTAFYGRFGIAIKHTGWQMALCPFHDDKHASLAVNGEHGMNYIANEQLTNAITSTLSRDKGLIAMQASMDNLTAIYPYYQDDKEVFVKVRFDKDGKKWIKPFYFDGKKYELGETKLAKKPLYLPAPLTDTVYIVEGEKCVHSLINIGLCATTTGGATSINKCDLSPLLERKCVLWRDNDDSGIKWQDELTTALF